MSMILLFQLETRELEMVAASEIKAKEREKENELMVNDIDQLEEGKFFEKKRAKKKEREPERPPTPTEVLRQREEEWREREKKRHEKRRKRMDESEDHWSNDVRAENESLTRCSTLIDNILDSIDIDATEIDDESEMPQELLIDRGLLEQLRGEVQKLKMYKKMHEVPNDRVTRLLTILERNMRDVIASEGRSAIVPITDEECGEEENELFREMIDDRLQRGADAACTALIAITANKMPKTVFLEDTMERAVQVCKQYLTTIIFPASDILYQGVNKSKRIVEDTPKKKRKLGGANRTPIVQILYTRMLDLMGCFGELVRHHTLPDTFYHQLNTAALSCFFVNNIAELQLKAMTVLANIFSRVDDHIRSPLIQDLLNSLHRLPPKTNMNCYALSNNQTISYSSCLFQLLIQSSIKIPNRRRRKDEDEDDDDIVRDFSKEDGVLRDSIGEAKILCNKFIVGFLTKVVAKGEEEYRNLFSIFLQDLLTSFMVPEWPVAEMVLNGVTGYICTLYRNKVDVAVRCLIMEYLGLICARLSKEKKERGNDTEKRLAMIVKTMLYCERDDERTSLEEIDVSTMSNNDLLRKAERGLIDFLVVSNSSSEFSVEYAVKYYVGDWYRMTMEDIEGSRETYKAVKDAADNDKDRRKADRKLDKVEEKGRKQKEFLLELSDKKMIRKRADQVARSGSVMLNADAAWLIKHLAMNRDFCNSFDVFLKQILMGVTSEGAVGLRTRAMKSLTQIIEVDHTVLGNMDVRRSVQARMTDPNAQVREATIELLGKFIVARPDLIQDYYNIIIERIKDSGTSVRKRIIRIMREYCEKNPEYEKNSEMLSRIVRRVNDEEGVRKLVLDTMGALWLQPVKYKEVLAKKVAVLTEVITILMRESGGLDSLEAVFAALLKSDGEKAAIAATLQIVDTLFDEVIQLDIMVDGDETLSQAEKAKKRQDKMLACLAGLSIFSKVRPVLLLKHIEALQPYLSMSAKTTVEQSVLNQVILMLERVIPLIDHPSAEFISRVDKNLGELVKTTGMTITASAISCAAALHKKSPKLRPCITALFLQYLKGILTWRKKLEVPGTEINQQVMPIIQRSVFALGLMARYYDWDSILSDEEVGALSLLTTQPLIEKNEDETEKEGEGKRAIRDNVYLLLHFFSGHIDPNLRTKALTALGHVSAEYPEYLQRDEVLAIYAYALKSNDRNSLQMKIQALKNLEMFLLNEEKKALKTTQEWERIKDDQELKEMELAGSGLGSAVIQRYWQTVLDSYFHPLVDVRLAAMQVVWQTLSQGLVTPGSSIHVLIAMSTDPIPAIRHKVESLVKDIDNKYQGMVQSKAVQGVRSAFTLQKRVREDVNSFVRGIRAVEQSAMSSGKAVSMVYGAPKNSNDGQALLSGLYQSLRGNKQQRRSLVNSMLRLFTEDTKDTHTLSIDEWIFIADNLAMFPYQVLDEPLYVCKSVESVLTIHGHSMLNQFVSELAPIREGENNDDDYVFMAEPLLGRFPADTTQLYKIMDQSQAYFTLIYLKNFLMKFYSITEARIQEYSTSDTSKGHDKGLARKSITMFQPISSMQQLKPDVRAMRGTRDGNYALACHIAQFRRLLLSIDNKDGEDDDDVKTDNPNQEYDEEEMNMEE
ncbi:pqn-85 [Pristionchus pacificus]|uniref:Nipped-B protein n=1 Tax=Pristionchus pacificus TaxID=54126 RepID=A0A2A6CJ77_PRIPA|nr:pqn-85 [Pristionchus pacificus]|eukprot:PDM78071.1 pqn-85 [Pristionchus pacificus]